MKIFLLYDSNGRPAKELISKIEENSNKIIYWIGSPGGEIDNPPESIFHSSLDALLGLPARNIDISKFVPPDKDLIEKLYKTESLILTMMNAKYDNLCVSERKHLYYNMLQYWHGVLTTYKPDMIIHGIIPHAAHTFLIQELARLLNIKTLMFEDTGVSDRLLAFNDFRDGSKNLIEKIQNNRDKNFSLKDLNNDIQEYYKLQLDVKRDATPVYIDVLKNRYSGLGSFVRKIKRLKKSIRKGIVFKVLVQAVINRLKTNLKAEYRRVQKEPDLNQKFIYVPLHLQPECTTSPKGDIFVDQILMIEILSASLPSDWIIYVKEHPIQWYHRGLNFSGARYKSYYKKISEIKNVKLIPIQAGTYALINKAQTIATVTGTAGWEAIMRSKPTLVFGQAWYRDCHGAFKVEDVESCKLALKEIVNGFIVNQQKIINYLKSFDEATIHGYFDPDYEKSSKLTKEENKNNIINKILLEINNK